MKLSDSKYSGTTVAIIFSLVSFLLTFTFIIPMISIIPVGAFVEFISRIFSSGHKAGQITIVLLLLLTVAFLLLTIWYIKKKLTEHKKISNEKIVVLMMIFYFIVHPLGFYIYWGVNMNFRPDGQIIFLAFDTFPYSSLLFFPFGLLIDWTRNTVAKEIQLEKQED